MRSPIPHFPLVHPFNTARVHVLACGPLPPNTHTHPRTRVHTHTHAHTHTHTHTHTRTRARARACCPAEETPITCQHCLSEAMLPILLYTSPMFRKISAIDGYVVKFTSKASVPERILVCQSSTLQEFYFGKPSRVCGILVSERNR
jgi:hypothetical protein